MGKLLDLQHVILANAPWTHSRKPHVTATMDGECDRQPFPDSGKVRPLAVHRHLIHFITVRHFVDEQPPNRQKGIGLPCPIAVPCRIAFDHGRGLARS